MIYFESEFCKVSYLLEDNVVLIAWKKFCCFEDYRKPALIAAELLNQHKDSHLVIDARNGFEGRQEDVDWGFRVLLPKMATSDCKLVVFIKNVCGTIDEELDLWTKEFLKYFSVLSVIDEITAYKAVRDFRNKNVEHI